jgi:hypothetical protein
MKHILGYIIKNEITMRKVIWIIFFLSFQYSFSQNHIELNGQINQDNSVDLFYSKDVPGSYCIYLNFTKHENTQTPENKFIVFGSGGKLFTLKPTNRDQSIQYSYRYTYMRGIPNPKLDSTFVYLLPFKNNISVDVLYLSYLGSKYFGQEEPKNWRAFQFNCNKADTICSARKGIVVSVVDNYSLDTAQLVSYSSKRNTILIEHKDGTYARYEGFDSKKIFVKEGDQVLPNQPLGLLNQYDKSGTYQLRFSIDYLIGSIENLSEDSMKKRKSDYNYLNPYFQTTEGVLKLLPNKRYTAQITEKAIIKELSTKELKKRQNTFLH